jgi:Tfp pilus assembly protein PilO
MKDMLSRGSWIVTLPLAGLAVAYVMLIYLPARQTDAELQDQLQQRQEYLSQAKTRTAALTAIHQTLEQTNAYRTRWIERAPRRHNVAELYGQIHMLAKDAGVTITRFDPQDPVERSYLIELPLSIGCVAPFAETFEFIRGIESMPEEVWVRRVRFDNTQQQGGDVLCEIDLVIFTARNEISGYEESAN